MGLARPAPRTVLDRDALAASGRANLGEVLQQLPVQSNALNAQVNNGGDGSTRVSLRGLGADRTVTLINGRRVVATGTGANDSVDLGSIPLAVIDRVEVFRGGEPMTYGSDAVGGVVNIITRTELDGAEASIYTGAAQRVDGFTVDASFIAGHRLESRRGNIVVAAGIQRQDPVMAGDRSFSKQVFGFDFANRTRSVNGSTSATAGRIDAFNLDTNGDGKPERVNLCGEAVQYCTADGVGGYRPFETPGDLYNFAPSNYLYTPSSRYSVYGAGSYTLDPRLSTFFEASYLHRASDSQFAPEPFTSLSARLGISRDSLYNPLDADVQGYSRRLEELGPRRQLRDIGSLQVVAGLRGAVPEVPSWTWELSYNRGHSGGSLRTEGDLLVERLANAVGPSFVDASGVPRCGRPDQVIPGCVPIDLMGPIGSIDARARDYLLATGSARGFNDQQTVLATARGRLVELPNHGSLSAQFGADVRKEAGDYTVDPPVGVDIAPGEVSYQVVEGFGELSLVPLSELPLARWVELSLGLRGSRYDAFGSAVTWNAGALFRTIHGIAFRGTYATRFRPPSARERLGDDEIYLNAEDPCDTRPNSARGATIVLAPMAAAQCARQGVSPDAAFGTSQQPAVEVPSPTLRAETANVLTAGVIVEPPQIRGLAVAADYWKTDISQAVQSVPLASILSDCYRRGIESSCDQIHRDPGQSYAIEYILSPIDNLGSISTSGVDAAVAYEHRFGGLGRLQTQLDAQYLFTYNLDTTTQIIHGRGNFDLGAHPALEASLTSGWQDTSGIGAGLKLRYIGSFRECHQSNCNAAELSRDVDAWYKLDLFGSYTLPHVAGTTTLLAGVNNLLDRSPAVIYSGGEGNTDGTTYDLLGRFFYVRLSHRF
jgi:iron complex outermembrane recepter protein